MFTKDRTGSIVFQIAFLLALLLVLPLFFSAGIYSLCRIGLDLIALSDRWF